MQSPSTMAPASKRLLQSNKKRTATDRSSDSSDDEGVGHKSLAPMKRTRIEGKAQKSSPPVSRPVKKTRGSSGLKVKGMGAQESELKKPISDIPPSSSEFGAAVAEETVVEPSPSVTTFSPELVSIAAAASDLADQISDTSNLTSSPAVAPPSPPTAASDNAGSSSNVTSPVSSVSPDIASEVAAASSDTARLAQICYRLILEKETMQASNDEVVAYLMFTIDEKEEMIDKAKEETKRASEKTIAELRQELGLEKQKSHKFESDYHDSQVEIQKLHANCKCGKSEWFVELKREAIHDHLMKKEHCLKELRDLQSAHKTLKEEHEQCARVKNHILDEYEELESRMKKQGHDFAELQQKHADCQNKNQGSQDMLNATVAWVNNMVQSCPVPIDHVVELEADLDRAVNKMNRYKKTLDQIRRLEKEQKKLQNHLNHSFGGRAELQEQQQQHGDHNSNDSDGVDHHRRSYTPQPPSPGSFRDRAIFQCQHDRGINHEGKCRHCHEQVYLPAGPENDFLPDPEYYDNQVNEEPVIIKQEETEPYQHQAPQQEVPIPDAFLPVVNGDQAPDLDDSFDENGNCFHLYLWADGKTCKACGKDNCNQSPQVAATVPSSPVSAPEVSAPVVSRPVVSAPEVEKPCGLSPSPQPSSPASKKRNLGFKEDSDSESESEANPRPAKRVKSAGTSSVNSRPQASTGPSAANYFKPAHSGWSNPAVLGDSSATRSSSSYFKPAHSGWSNPAILGVTQQVVSPETIPPPVASSSRPAHSSFGLSTPRFVYSGAPFSGQVPSPVASLSEQAPLVPATTLSESSDSNVGLPAVSPNEETGIGPDSDVERIKKESRDDEKDVVEEEDLTNKDESHVSG